MRNRQEERQTSIHSKGFGLTNSRQSYEGPSLGAPTDYGSIKLGTKTVEDAVLNLNAIKRVHPQFGDKNFILKAIAERNYYLMREISDYFYRTSGIYQRVCDYFAFMYRFDWYIVPEVFDENVKTEKILGDFDKILSYLDNSQIKSLCGGMALNVIKYGAYYGYIVPCADRLVVQELPVNYCRTIMTSGGMPVVEFDMRFFDDNFKDINYRLKILKMFPKDIQKGYMLYKQGKLDPDYTGWGNPQRRGDPCGHEWDCGIHRAFTGSWYTLDPASTIKFTMGNGIEQPIFINAIPAILDLEDAQELDKKKQMQELMKIVIQELPLDKNGDLIFDVDEARDIHNNAVEMLAHAIGVDVLTTFAKISVEDVADNSASTSTDDIQRVERAVYNKFGVSRNLFNTDTNLALEKSILNDESTVRQLLLQFTAFFDRAVQSLGSNKKKYNYRLYMLETTQYNYKELSKMYKEQVQMGYSKILPQIALGHSQSSIIHTAYFENNVQKLIEIMIPPMLSSTMSADVILGKKDESSKSKTQNTTESSSTVKVSSTNDPYATKGEAGRPEKAEGEKSDKTIANNESM